MGALVDEHRTSADVLVGAAERCGLASSESERRMCARIAALEAEACDAVELRKRERAARSADAQLATPAHAALCCARGLILLRAASPSATPPSRWRTASATACARRLSADAEARAIELAARTTEALLEAAAAGAAAESHASASTAVTRPTPPPSRAGRPRRVRGRAARPRALEAQLQAALNQRAAHAAMAAREAAEAEVVKAHNARRWPRLPQPSAAAAAVLPLGAGGAAAGGAAADAGALALAPAAEAAGAAGVRSQ
jgi:hypothetical protein